MIKSLMLHWLTGSITMDNSQLYQLMNDSDALEHITITDLRRYISIYPFFQSAKVLLLKKMKMEASLAFDRELKKSAVYIADRAKLYTFLNPVKILSTGGIHEGGALFADTQNGKGDISTSLSINSEANFNYLFLSTDEKTDTPEHEESVVDYFKEKDCPVNDEEKPESGLIDKFVNTEHKKIKIKTDANAPIVNLAEASSKEKPAVLTETLANIYIKQKKYQKAINIFDSLSLKIPEKSAYFADRTKEIKILLENS